MNKQIEFLDLPYEIQQKILDQLDQKDHVSLYRVSKEWQFLMRQYLNDKNSIKSVDWKWYCRHRPQIPHCSRCLERLRNKNDSRGLANDWEWWI